MKKSALILFSVPLYLIAACSDEAAPEGRANDAQEGEIAGDILGGTISDDMLPLDQLTSQSPSAREDPEGAANTPASASRETSTSSGASETAPPAASEAETIVAAEPPAAAPANTPPVARPVAPPPAETGPSVAPPTDDRQ